MLALGVAAQTAGTIFVSTPAFLIPLLHSGQGMSLAQAGLLAGAPTLGMVLTLVAWGALADRFGERRIIAGGLALTALAIAGAIAIPGYLALATFFLLGGMAAASTNAASGRVVVGWFAKERRGLAMGVRQMSQPLGVTFAALTVPSLAAGTGISAALMVPFVMVAALAVACAIAIRNPPRLVLSMLSGAAPVPNPYASGGFLWRIHGVSVLLVVPQFLLSTFGLVWLVTEQHWEALPAGALIAVSQFIGAVGRIGVGVLSDRVGSRVRPLRWVAISAGGAMLMLFAATTMTVADNGLAFTSVAEMAGPAWVGRALGLQNTGQFIAASVVGPVMGLLIGLVGYPAVFAVTALFPAIAVPLVPGAEAEKDRL